MMCDITLAVGTSSGNSGAGPQPKAGRLKERKNRIKHKRQLLGFCKIPESFRLEKFSQTIESKL